jgi:hypothetical protein
VLGVFRCVVVAAWPILDLLRTGLTAGLLRVCDCGRAALEVEDPIDFFSDLTAGVFSGVVVVDGVILPPGRTEYGSAVFGLFSSGRRIGRRTVPLIRDPVPVELFKVDFVDSPDMADGGRAGPEDAVEALDILLALAPSDLVEIDLGGEYVAAAELGRSGMPLAAANLARLCSAIFSFRLVLAIPGPTDLENDDTAGCDDASDALGLFGSLSKPVFSRFSRVSYILWLKSAIASISMCGQTHASAL